LLACLAALTLGPHKQCPGKQAPSRDALWQPMRTGNTNLEQSLVARVLALGYGRLRFPEPLEREFRNEHLTASRRRARLGLLIVAGACAGFSIMDHSLIHSAGAAPDVVRFGMQLPVLMLALIATFQKLYMTWYPRVMLLGGPIFGLGTVLLTVYAPAEHAPVLGMRIVLFAFFYFFMSGLRLKATLAGNLVVLSSLVTCGALGLLSADITLYLSFALVFANVVGAGGAYALEHAHRTSFLEGRLLVEITELDGLTRLLNRQTFESRVRALWHRAMSQQSPVSVVMVDVDHFKLYNDQYGQQAGDECLRNVAAAVRAAVGMRQEDLLARYGGEEIIAVLVARSPLDARTTAQRIVREVAALNIPHASAADHARVSVSVGAATQLPSMSSSYDSIMRLADSALYTAKQQGRNCSRSVEVSATVTAA
jgi:diguanylate cyclase (GGDEF)-like protein